MYRTVKILKCPGFGGASHYEAQSLPNMAWTGLTLFYVEKEEVKLELSRLLALCWTQG